VLQLIAAGCTSQEIADRLVISIHTVERHITHIYQKLGVVAAPEAVAAAFTHGIRLSRPVQRCPLGGRRRPAPSLRAPSFPGGTVKVLVAQVREHHGALRHVPGPTQPLDGSSAADSVLRAGYCQHVAKSPFDELKRLQNA